MGKLVLDEIVVTPDLLCKIEGIQKKTKEGDFAVTALGEGSRHGDIALAFGGLKLEFNIEAVDQVIELLNLVKDEKGV